MTNLGPSLRYKKIKARHDCRNEFLPRIDHGILTKYSGEIIVMLCQLLKNTIKFHSTIPKVHETSAFYFSSHVSIFFNVGIVE